MRSRQGETFHLSISSVESASACVRHFIAATFGAHMGGDLMVEGIATEMVQGLLSAPR